MRFPKSVAFALSCASVAGGIAFGVAAASPADAAVTATPRHGWHDHHRQSSWLSGRSRSLNANRHHEATLVVNRFRLANISRNNNSAQQDQNARSRSNSAAAAGGGGGGGGGGGDRDGQQQQPQARPNTDAANAGPTIAGPANAGPANAGPTIAGPANAGPANAGPADAGPANAGPADDLKSLVS
jgi:hypothetical protein